MSTFVTSAKASNSTLQSFTSSVSRWDNRTVTLFLGLVGIVALAVYVYIQRSRAFVLERDSEGYYTLPHFEVPGFKNEGTFKSPEIKICVGKFVIDTANGIVPPGWILKR